MGGQSASSELTGIIPSMLPPNYGFNRGFFNQILPGWTNYDPGSYTQSGGQLNRPSSPSQQAATAMGQKWATSPMNQEYGQYTKGVLGNLYGSGGGINQQYNPGSAANALERFLSPGFINPSYGGAPWAQGRQLGGNPGYEGSPRMQPERPHTGNQSVTRQLFNQRSSVPGPGSGGGPGPGHGIYTPNGQGG